MPLPLLPHHSRIICVYLKAEAVSLGQYQDLQSARSRDPLPGPGQLGAAGNESWECKDAWMESPERTTEGKKNQKGKCRRPERKKWTF